MDPPNGRRGHRLRDPGPRDPGDAGPPGPRLDPVADAGRRRARRIPGLARAGDRSTRQLRRIRDGAPRQRDGPGRAAGLPDRAGRLPGPPSGARRKPAVHPAGGLRGGGDLRVAALRLARDRDRLGSRLPGLAVDGRLAGPAPDRGDRGPRPAPLGGGRRGADRPGSGDRRVANAARTPDPRPARHRCHGPVRDPDRDRRRTGPDPARRMDPDAAPRARGGHLGEPGRAVGDELLHGALRGGRRGRS